MEPKKMSKTQFKKEEQEFIDAIMACDDPEGEIEQNFNKYMPVIANGEEKKELLLAMYHREMKKKDDEINLFEAEVRFLRKLPSVRIKKLFYCLICYSHVHPHPSGWIKFEPKELWRYAWASKTPKLIQPEAYHPCMGHGLDLMVRGKKNPMVCYKVLLDKGDKVCYTFHESEAVGRMKEVCGIEDGK